MISESRIFVYRFEELVLDEGGPTYIIRPRLVLLVEDMAASFTTSAFPSSTSITLSSSRTRSIASYVAASVAPTQETPPHFFVNQKKAWEEQMNKKNHEQHDINALITKILIPLFSVVLLLSFLACAFGPRLLRRNPPMSRESTMERNDEVEMRWRRRSVWEEPPPPYAAEEDPEKAQGIIDDERRKAGQSDNGTRVQGATLSVPPPVYLGTER